MCAAQTLDSDFTYKYIFFFYFATTTVGRCGLKTDGILCGVSLVGLGPSIGCVVTLAAIVNSLVSSRRAFRWSSVFHAHDNGKSAHSLDFYALFYGTHRPNGRLRRACGEKFFSMFQVLSHLGSSSPMFLGGTNR